VVLALLAAHHIFHISRIKVKVVPPYFSDGADENYGKLMHGFRLPPRCK
jgi:hypothetical protein